MNYLSRDKRISILAALVEGCSIRATARMTSSSKNTVLKFLMDIGMVCADYQHEALVNLPCQRIQCDEVWSFCYSKTKNALEDRRAAGEAGDVWTWTAICADTKLVPSWLVGERSAVWAIEFMQDLASRLTTRVQLTTDGHKPFLEAVEGAFGIDVNYAMLIEKYGEGQKSVEPRYSPAVRTDTEVRTIMGQPGSKYVATSYAKRQNLIMQMHTHRFTRLTNALSKKIENHSRAVALHYMHYNFCKVHRLLRITPAMAAGVTDRLWNHGDVVDLLINKERRAQTETGARSTLVDSKL